MSDTSLKIKKIRVGKMDENCYVVIDTDSHQSLIIDPGDEGNFIAEQLEQLSVTPIAIAATHGHFDHIMGARELQMIYHIPFYVHESDVFLVKRMKETAEYFLEHMVVESPPDVGRLLTDHDTISFGSHIISVIATPGHTPGSVCYHIPKYHILFVGDTIFADGSVGRTDFSYSEPKELEKSIHNIFALPGETIVYPGHGAETSVSAEKRFRSL